MIDFLKIHKKYPIAFQLFSVWHYKGTRSLYDFFDDMGIRCFIGYGTGSGKYKLEIYRKKTKDESGGDGDWRMIRIGFVSQYLSRNLAEDIVFEKAFEILEKIEIKLNN